MTEGFEHTRSAEDVAASNAEAPEATATSPSAKAAPVALGTMLGNALLTIGGVKTLYVGYPVKGAKAGQLAYVTSEYTDIDGTVKPLQIPVVIDEVGANAPRGKLTKEQLKAAGYRSDEGIAQRVASAPDYFQRLVSSVSTHDSLHADDSMRGFIETAPASRISYHVATPEEVTALGGDLETESRNLERASRLLRLAMRDDKSSVVDALAFAKTELNITPTDLSSAKQSLIGSYERAAEAAVTSGRAA